MAILALNQSGDLSITDGKFDFIEGVNATRQKLASRFKFFLGEWFLDQREGIPYYRSVFVKNPDLAVIRSIFRRVLLDTPPVSSVPTFNVVYTPSTRSLAFEFEALLSTGEKIIVKPEDRDFIVKV